MFVEFRDEARILFLTPRDKQRYHRSVDESTFQTVHLPARVGQYYRRVEPAQSLVTSSTDLYRFIRLCLIAQDKKPAATAEICKTFVVGKISAELEWVRHSHLHILGGW